MNDGPEWEGAAPVPRGTTPEDFKKARRQQARLEEPGLDRLPPHSTEAEQGVLGCALLAPVDVIAECQARRLEPGHFYDLRHQQIFHAITTLYDAGTPVDIITLHEWLKGKGLVEAVGGLGYMAALPDAVPSAANLDYYLQIVREKFVLRRLIAGCTEVVARAFEHTGEVDTLLDEFQRDALRLTEGVGEQRVLTVKGALPGVLDDLEDGYHRGGAQIKGLTTGLAYLDKILCGMGGKHGNFIVLAARPGVGKSALGMQIAAHAALNFKWFTPVVGADGKVETDEHGKTKWQAHTGIPVGVFSLEMSAEELVKRLLFLHSGVDAQRFKTGFALKEDFERLGESSKKIGKAPIYIDEDDSLTIDALMARARLMVRQFGIKLFIVDYIQCLQVAQKRFRQDRVQEMAEISNGLRRLGKQLGVPFIVLAQMNRDFAKEKGIRTPRLEDLRDSGSIEQDAHVVMFLYEDDSGGEKGKKEFEDELKAVLGEQRGDWSATPRKMRLLVAKNRHGMSNKDSKLIFDGSCTRFEDYFEWRKNHGLQDRAKGDPKPVEQEEML